MADNYTNRAPSMADNYTNKAPSVADNPGFCYDEGTRLNLESIPKKNDSQELFDGIKEQIKSATSALYVELAEDSRDMIDTAMAALSHRLNGTQQDCCSLQDVTEAGVAPDIEDLSSLADKRSGEC